MKQGATPNKPSNSMETLAKIIVGVLFLAVLGLFIYLLNPFSKPQPTNDTAETTVTPKKADEDKQEYQFYQILREQDVTGATAKPIESSVKNKPDAVVIQKKPAQSTQNSQTANTAETDTTPTETENTLAKPKDTDAEITATNNPPSQSPKASETAKAVIENADVKQTYILQINSFDNADDADRRRAEVLMAGVDAQIVKRRLEDGSTLYQVISRQMPNAQMAQQAQKRLQNSGIDSLIVEQRRK